MVGVTILSIFQIGFYCTIVSVSYVLNTSLIPSIKFNVQVAVAFSFLFASETVATIDQSQPFGRSELNDEVLDTTTFRFQLPSQPLRQGGEEVDSEIEDITSIYWRKKND